MNLKKSLIVLFAVFLLAAFTVSAEDWMLGNWVRKEKDIEPGTPITLKVEQWGSKDGRKLTYELKNPNPGGPGPEKMVLTIETPMDGSEVPVMINGNPTGETMAIKRLDDRHVVSTVKMNGQKLGTSKGVYDDAGKMFTVENDFKNDLSGPEPGENTEIWVKK